MKRFPIAMMAFAALAPASSFASGGKVADYVKQRLTEDGYSVENLEVSHQDLVPSHQLSRIFAPVADFAREWINSDWVTMQYYDVSFSTPQGYSYGCVAGIGNNAQYAEGARYVEIKTCQVSLSAEDDDHLVKPKVVQLPR